MDLIVLAIAGFGGLAWGTLHLIRSTRMLDKPLSAELWLVARVSTAVLFGAFAMAGAVTIALDRLR